MYGKRISLSLALALAVSAPLDAYNLLTGGGWASPPTFLVDHRGMPSVTDGDHGLTRVVSSVAIWSSSAAGTVVHAQSSATFGGFAMGDGVPTINFSGCGEGCIAMALNTYAGDGTILDSDIISLRDVGSSNLWTSFAEPGGCSQEFYLDGVMVHEVGHGLGLAHSQVPSATMFAGPFQCETLSYLTLDPDDNAGIVALYGNPPPVARFTYTCSGLTCTFNGTSSTDDQGIIDYSWSFGDGSVGSGSIAGHTFAEPGVYTVILSVTDTTWQVGTTFKAVDPTAPPPDLPPTANFTFNCSGLTCLFDGTSSTDDHGITEYNWNFGDFHPGYGPALMHTYEQPGTYWVVLTVIDGSYQSASRLKIVTVSDP